MKKFIFVFSLLISNIAFCAEFNPEQISGFSNVEKANFINCLDRLIEYKSSWERSWQLFIIKKSLTVEQSKERCECHDKHEKLSEAFYNARNKLPKAHKKIFNAFAKINSQSLINIRSTLN